MQAFSFSQLRTKSASVYGASLSIRSWGCGHARQREAGDRNGGVPEGDRTDPLPHVDVATSVCGRAFHAGTPVCSVNGASARVLHNRAQFAGERTGDRERERKRDRYAESLISSISEG